MSEQPDGRTPVPDAAWEAGLQAIRDEPRGACENARVWRVVYAVLNAAGFDAGDPVVKRHAEPCGFRDPLTRGSVAGAERSDPK